MFKRSAISVLVLFVLLFAMMLFPFGSLFSQMFSQADAHHSGFTEIVQSSSWWHAVGSSLRISLTSTFFAAVIGIGIAFALYYAPFKGSALLVRFMELMVAVPSFLIAFALIYLYGAHGSLNVFLNRLMHTDQPVLDFLYSPKGIIAAEATYYIPFMIRPTLAVLEMLDPSLDQAALSLGARPARVFRKIVAPLALPGISAGIILAFLMIQNEFGILLVLGSQKSPTMPISIYNTAMINLDLPGAAVQAMFMLLVVTALYALYRALMQRSLKTASLQMNGKGIARSPSVNSAGPMGRAIAILVTLAALVIFVLPIVVIVLSAVSQKWTNTILPSGYTWKWFSALGRDDYASLRSSLWMGLSVSLLACIIGTAAAFIQKRLRGALASLIDFLLLLPNAVPSVVIGLMILMAYHKPPVDLSGSSFIVLLAQLLLALPFCYRIMNAALDKLPASFAEAAAGLGASPLRRLTRVTLPLLFPSLRACFALCFALSIGELGATMMVYPPGFATAPIVIVHYVERGYYYQGSALAVLMLLMTLVCLCIVAVFRPLAWASRLYRLLSVANTRKGEITYEN
ncbi:2-aminoethylphosphonate ABC transporter permease subunit [Paenibacillus lycopersici]|uniref:2-aminoethylphosphonate ABC transporter permease subunit n=1 Tax=Paenibacillus lycopersici TaxID=2704462 RepID=A0A6C0FUE9_9BACL|nr:2-aminoethylphosphonate ABC transporter permease subunit [Paenibacillus lycopersici]QHT58549.1 2-aminoethylphosphonate ABC transporter permease subunit [Paenibacillus lycopersici]